MYEQSTYMPAQTKQKKYLGIFFTPEWVIKLMVNLIDSFFLSKDALRILEPACGSCQFLLGIKKHRPEVYKKSSTMVGVEIRGDILNYPFERNTRIKLINSDYLLWTTNDKYDLIIGNPPYGIPSLSEHYTIKVDGETKDKYKKIYETWYGKYNVYGAFIEKSIKLLKEGGQLIFIVPATFMILDEFKKLRSFIALHGNTEIIYMGADVFKPEADVTTVILKFTKSKLGRGRLTLYDFKDGNLNMIYKTNSWKGEIILFSSEFTREIDNICSFKLSDIYTIRISPRTPEIKNSTDVIKAKHPLDTTELLPILNGKNLKVGKILYQPLSGYWIEKRKKNKLRKFFDKPHIVVGLGFRGNRQIGSAYDSKAYPWMGDVYHLLREYTLTNGNFNLTDEEMVNFLNSDIVSRYINEVFRDITYHLSITQLSIIPIPTKKELEKLKEIVNWKETGEKI